MSQLYSVSWLQEKQDNLENIKYLFFWGHTKQHNQEVGNFCFSQWFESDFIIDGITYKTTEHWMMAQKAKLFNDQEIYNKIINCKKPGEAKDLGRLVTNFNDEIWQKHRYDIVKIGNIHKFNQNKALGEYLIKTQSRVLVEASPVDIIWGIGLTKDSDKANNVYEWRGLNLLGFALMEVRDLLNEYGTGSEQLSKIKSDI
ncbi:NADAR family protein [Flammeovirga agarivorans]|uniref:NADAR family protein n=1 Tax=Flammeovirga agarivorans TaxID=2726742 RepID=A0A7X8XZC7_9BACT|nr:NADAR family protein [Flammeovirga agarivorans]NLR95059.1 NADAR family protein [Flammeovirga agarivorans]